MVKHATSHGLSIFSCTIISSLIVELFKPYLPEVFSKLKFVSEKIVTLSHLPLSPESMNILIIASALGIIWGIIFKLRFVKD